MPPVHARVQMASFNTDQRLVKPMGKVKGRDRDEEKRDKNPRTHSPYPLLFFLMIRDCSFFSLFPACRTGP
jgi:hypothetical protein